MRKKLGDNTCARKMEEEANERKMKLNEWKGR